MPEKAKLDKFYLFTITVGRFTKITFQTINLVNIISVC